MFTRYPPAQLGAYEAVPARATTVARAGALSGADLLSARMAEGAEFTATHLVPASGVDTWTEPDPEKQPDNRIEAGQPVELIEETTGWAHVRCTNGWETWVDASKLEALSTPGFIPTHRVVASGVDARESPDMAQPVAARLDPGLLVSVINTWGGWSKVKCENEWEAWVDTRGLVVGTAPGAGAATRVAAQANPLAMWLLIGGAAAVILGSFLDWYGPGASGWDLPFVALFDHTTTAGNDFSAGLVLLLCAAAAIPLITRKPLPKVWALVVAGIATNVALMAMYLYLDVFDGVPGVGIKVGLILTLLGAGAMAAGALMTPRRSA